MNSRQLMGWVQSSEQERLGDSSLYMCGQGYRCKKECLEESVDVRRHEGLRQSLENNGSWAGVKETEKEHPERSEEGQLGRCPETTLIRGTGNGG